MHALIKNGAVAQYPYTIGNLRRDNHYTSFPKRPSDASLKLWGMEVVISVDRPVTGHTQNLTEGDPALIGGQWRQTWVITDATPEEVTERAARQADDARAKRNTLLAATDYFALTDVPMTAAMTTYRQALRDITAHANFPNLDEADWPLKP